MNVSPVNEGKERFTWHPPEATGCAGLPKKWESEAAALMGAVSSWVLSPTPSFIPSPNISSEGMPVPQAGHSQTGTLGLLGGGWARGREQPRGWGERVVEVSSTFLLSALQRVPKRI